MRTDAKDSRGFDGTEIWEIDGGRIWRFETGEETKSISLELCLRLRKSMCCSRLVIKTGKTEELWVHQGGRERPDWKTVWKTGGNVRRYIKADDFAKGNLRVRLR